MILNQSDAQKEAQKIGQALREGGIALSDIAPAEKVSAKSQEKKAAALSDEFTLAAISSAIGQITGVSTMEGLKALLKHIEKLASSIALPENKTRIPDSMQQAAGKLEQLRRDEEQRQEIMADILRIDPQDKPETVALMTALDKGHHFTDKQIELLNSIAADTKYDVTTYEKVVTQDGKTIYQEKDKKIADGAKMRDSYSIFVAGMRDDEEKLDDASKKAYNKRIYGDEKGPKGANAAERGKSRREGSAIVKDAMQDVAALAESKIKPHKQEQRQAVQTTLKESMSVIDKIDALEEQRDALRDRGLTTEALDAEIRGLKKQRANHKEELDSAAKGQDIAPAPSTPALPQELIAKNVSDPTIAEKPSATPQGKPMQGFANKLVSR